MNRTPLEWAELGAIPDWLLRAGIRWLLASRLRLQRRGGLTRRHEAFREFLHKLRDGPIAVEKDKANEQHYEVPAEFFLKVLGPRLKYSCCYWPSGVASLEKAEVASLRLTTRRAQIEDGMRVLELGCGWGAVSLWMAEQFPNSRIVAVSNSNSQREFIEARARDRGFGNLEVQTANVATLDVDERFDRVVSVEMFEHMRNYDRLMANVARWLDPDGKLFVHIFCHREFAYPFELDHGIDWMARHFFSGGVMPSDHLLLYFQNDLTLEDHWRLDGRHYQKTLDAWLALQDASRDEVMPIVRDVYGPEDAERWFQRWRIFFMACSELFGYRGGGEWFVSHYLFRK